MNSRRVKFKEGDYIKKCPKCGNNTEFTVKSDYCAEDCCEIWVNCKCGYDPTAEKHALRIEDVWGGVNDDNCKAAIEVSWNEALEYHSLNQSK
jgi:hypothetical protein